MSLTSCYRYILELPAATLQGQIKEALKEDDGAGIIGSLHWEDVPIGGRTATVEAHFEDPDAHPPGLALGVAELSATLSLAMRLEVQVNEIVGLDAIGYSVTFDLPGLFEKDASIPPRLNLAFPAVAEADVNLVVSGGAIPLSAALLEPRIHAIYADNPSMGHDVQTNVPWPGVADGVLVTTDIYDDPPGSSGFRGAITVQIAGDTQFKIVMPGHFQIRSLVTTYVDTDMTIEVLVAVEQADGQVIAKLGAVQSADVTVTFASTSMYDLAARPILQSEVAARFQSFGDQSESVPTSAEVAALITERVLAMASSLVIPVFTPAAPGAGDIDLTTFVPTTVNQQVLALQLAPLEDGTTCDAPDVFARADGFSIAIAAAEVNGMLQPMLAASLGDRSAAGYDMTVTRLDGTLSDPGTNGQERGHIWVDGTTDVHVDCWPDPTVDFWGPIFLLPEKDADGRLVFKADAGEFDADEPCCADVDPAQIAQLIEGQQSTPFALPTAYAGVGEVNLNVTEAEIFAVGVVVHGTLEVITSHALHGAEIRRGTYWDTEPAGGG